ncbi:MAG: nitrile hydratase [Candidatus Entotheonella factor]|uniref:nitrile hydratase n=1 Tax=Entotheonella factor TaxID=1429438 RepID=W4LCG2_ENTF1|nr:nitrile hydratase subunit alpha [Candidatus Entotheonella palauensis]ETW95619.1 MAG: nitrile hydratase [Candidatus Entotheonella factor]
MHDDHHGHDHDAHAPIEHAHEMGEHEKRIRAIQALLIEKGIVTGDELRRQEEIMDTISPALGARVVARAWVDAGFKARLLADAKTALPELGIEPDPMTTLVAIENRDKLHNVVVCTLCSCYPRTLLGLPPAWYKSLEYRSRVVSEPRQVLHEFGLELDPEVEVRVYDSTADIRYIVIPERPAGTEEMTEAELAELVTRDSMIGVAKASAPVAP